MKLRIVQKHNGERYRYIIEQLGFFGWRNGDGYLLSRSFDSCRDAEDAIENYVLMINTNEVILEKTI